MGEVQGIDVSHYQGLIDWVKVKKDGKEFAIMKCQYEAQSHRIDETFEYNYEKAGENDIARGVYIYIARHSIQDPVGDANALLNHLKGRKLEYGIWLDLEDKNLAPVGRDKIRNLALLYNDLFTRAGYYVGIYCNRDWYQRLISDDLKDKFDIWLARYPKNDTGSYNQFSALRPKYKEVVAWQYSSKGKVNGIKGNVDLDVDYDGIINLNQIQEEASTTYEHVGNPYIMPNINIKYGMAGCAVKWVQWELKQHGYNPGKIDGIFLDKTQKAVRDFQKESHILVDGIVGKQTRKALIGR